MSQAAIWPNFVQQLVDAPEGVDVGQGMDLDQWNAQSVATMASMTPEQVMAAFEENYGKLISFMKSVPDEQLNAKRRLFWEPIPVSDMLATYVVLHGLHHVYEASSRLGAPA